MPPARRPATFPVRFDPGLFDHDVSRARPAGRTIAHAAREQLERDGVEVNLLARCESQHRDGTDLGGLVKLYLPIPYGDWGLVLLGAGGREDPHLQALAFGERHPSRRPNVYDLAHYRRHGAWPPTMT